MYHFWPGFPAVSGCGIFISLIKCFTLLFFFIVGAAYLHLTVSSQPVFSSLNTETLMDSLGFLLHL
jgi:hypothetical protein